MGETTKKDPALEATAEEMTKALEDARDLYNLAAPGQTHVRIKRRALYLLVAMACHGVGISMVPNPPQQPGGSDA